MEKKTSITINGQVYPCYTTMGALMKLEKELGRPIQEIRSESVTDLVTMLWCQTWGACRREGIEFNYTIDDFADALDPSTLTEWAQTQVAEITGDDKKKAK